MSAILNRVSGMPYGRNMAVDWSIRKLIRSHICLREEIIARVFVEDFGIPCSCQHVFGEHNVVHTTHQYWTDLDSKADRWRRKEARYAYPASTLDAFQALCTQGRCSPQNVHPDSSVNYVCTYQW